MQQFRLIPNIAVDGDEFTSGALGLHWFPSAAASASKSSYETGVLTMLTGLIRTWTGWAVMTEIFGKKRKMVIRPYHPTLQNGQFNATAAAQDVKAATMLGTAAAGGRGMAWQLRIQR